jgi:uncharacterized protein (UPF0333 family)
MEKGIIIFTYFSLAIGLKITPNNYYVVIRIMLRRGGLMRRGQAAIEYLIILAVVVIIALIVIGVIGGFPGMTRGISERDSAAYWAGADVGITRYYLSHTADASSSQILIRNNRLFQINVTSITFAGGSNGLNASTELSGIIISPGSSSQILLNTTGAALCATQGNSYSENIVILYKDATYGNSYTFTGEKPLVGTCQ